MSTEVKSGASADLWTIDPTSKAGRVTLYDAAGNEIHPVPTGAYVMPLVRGRITAAIAANSLIWGMRAGASLTVFIRRIRIVCAFDGTAAASTQQFEFIRFVNANPTGGSVLTPIKKRGAYAGSTVQDARFNAGAALGVAGISFDGNGFGDFGVSRGATGASAMLELVFSSAAERFSRFELAPNEGLGIRTVVATVVGDSIQGAIEWDEKA